MKRTVSILLILACLMAMLPMMTFAENGTQTACKKLIALTFDDGPREFTQELLDGLKERGAKATFFLIGQRVDDYPDTVRRMYSDGHQVAQHSFSHFSMLRLSEAGVRSQIYRTDSAISKILGNQIPYLFRPPYGEYSAKTLRYIGRPAILWSIDTKDWEHHNPELICKTIMDNATDGAIILCHDVQQAHIEGALAAVDKLQAEGYELVTVNELFRRRGVILYDGAPYYSCPQTGVDMGAVQVPLVTTSPKGGLQEVRLLGTPNAVIYYTTDGSDPGFNGRAYSSPFLVDASTTLRAFCAFNRNGDRSETLTMNIGKAISCEPTVSVQDGCIVFSGGTGVQIRYTKDGSIPDVNGDLYEEPIPCFEGALTYRLFGQGCDGLLRTIYVSENGNLFWDVPCSEWYFKEMNQAVSEGLFNGTGMYRYEPDVNMTRAMFITTLYRMMDGKAFKDGSTELDFTDVASHTWYTDAVRWGVNQGLINGYEDGSFRPDSEIHREEMCVMLDRLFSLLGIKKTVGALDFTDAGSISGWAGASVARLVAADIIRGYADNCFYPGAAATRAQVAAVLVRTRAFIDENRK